MNKTELQTVACAVAAGDHTAFRTFYDHYYLRIYRFVYTLLRDVCDTEAVVSNIFCLIWEKRHLLANVQAMDAYLFQISRNESYHYLKKRNSAQCVSIEELFVEAAPSNESVIDTLTEQEMMRAYRQAVDQLPERCRRVFQLVREQKLSHKKVSELLGITPGTIEVQMNIAIKKITHTIRTAYPMFMASCQK